MIDVKFRGRRMIVSCLNCGHEQMGYSKIDGNRCDQCGDGPLEIKRWLDEEEPKKGTMLCSECEKLNIAMQLLKGLSWKDSRITFDSILGFDKESETILIDEKKLLKLIQLVNPIQKDRKIKLV